VEIRKSTRAANPDIFRFYGMLVKTETPIAIHYCSIEGENVKYSWYIMCFI